MMRNVKKISIRTTVYYALAFSLVILSFQACSNNAEPAFYVNIERDFDVPTSLGAVVTHIFELKNVPTNLEQNLGLFGVEKANITSINPGDARLTTAAGFMDWSVVATVEIYAVSRLKPSNRRQIFYVRGPDLNNSEEIRLFNTFADLKEIMEEETIDLEVQLTTSYATSGNFRAKLIFNYAVFDEI